MRDPALRASQGPLVARMSNGECKMQIGVIGLGRMGGNIARRLMQAGHSSVVYDANAAPVAAAGEGRRAGRRLAASARRGAPGSRAPSG